MADMATTRVEIGRMQMIIALHTKKAPSDAEWNTYIGLCQEALKILNGDSTRLAGIAITDGGAPNAKQRALLATIIKDVHIRGAVVTESTLVRGVVTALSWINPQIKAYSPTGVVDAALHLGLTRNDVPKLWEECVKTKTGLPAIVAAYGAVAKVFAGAQDKLSAAS